MSPERKEPAAAVLALVSVAVCCGLPVLLGAGGAVSVLGLGLGSWVLVTAGLTVVTLALGRGAPSPDCPRWRGHPQVG